MPKRKFCCRIFPVVAILIASVLTVLARYFSGDDQVFDFTADKDAFFTFLGTALFAALGPILLFYYLSDSERFENKARALALLSFIPVFVILYLVL